MSNDRAKAEYQMVQDFKRAWYFVQESNRIEGITRDPLEREMEAFKTFMGLEQIAVGDLCAFVKLVQPNAVLRNAVGLDVRVGNHIPPRGGPYIQNDLESLLYQVNAGTISAYDAHIKYETLHPFTDGNGRSGRMLWMWQMKKAPLGFLHTFYYQTLDNYQDRK